MAVNEKELARMVITLVGNATDYIKSLQAAKGATQKTARSIDSEARRLQRNRDRAAKEQVSAVVKQSNELIAAEHAKAMAVAKADVAKAKVAIDMAGKRATSEEKSRQREEDAHLAAARANVARLDMHRKAERQTANDVARMKKEVDRAGTEATLKEQERQRREDLKHGGLLNRQKAQAQKDADRRNVGLREEALRALADAQQKQVEIEAKGYLNAAKKIQAADDEKAKKLEASRATAAEKGKKFQEKLQNDARKLQEQNAKKDQKQAELVARRQAEAVEKARQQAAGRAAQRQHLMRDTAGGVRAVGAGVRGMDQFAFPITANIGQEFLNAASTIERAAATIAAAIAAATALSVKSFTDFDTAITDSTAIMTDLSATGKQDLEALAKTMATKGPHSASELAKGFYFLSSAGLNTISVMKALPIVQQYAIAGNLDLEVSSRHLSAALGSLGLKSNDAAENVANLTKISNLLVRAEVAGQATASQISEALARAGGTAQAYGISLEDATAILVAFHEKSIIGTSAAEQLDIMLRHMTQEAIENADAFEAAGVKVFDAGKNMRDMVDIIVDLNKRVEEMPAKSRIEQVMALGFTARIQKSVNLLAGMSDKLVELRKHLKESGLTTEEVANKKLATFANQLKMLRNTAQVVMIEVGAEFAKGLAPIGAAIRGALLLFREFWKSLGEEGRQNIIKWIAVVGAAATAVTGLMIAVKLLGVVLGVFNALLVLSGIKHVVLLGIWIAWKAAIIAANVALTLLNLTLTATTGAGFVAGLAALSLLFVGIHGVVTKLMSSFNAAKRAGSQLIGVFSDFSMFRGPLEAVSDIFFYWKDTLAEILRLAQSDSGAAFDVLQEAATVALMQFRDLWPPLWKFISDGAEATWQYIKLAFDKEFGPLYRDLVRIVDLFNKASRLNPFKLLDADEADRLKVAADKQKKINKELDTAAQRIRDIAKAWDYAESEQTKAAKATLADKILIAGAQVEIDRMMAEEGAAVVKKTEKDKRAEFEKTAKSQTEKIEHALTGSAEAFSRIQAQIMRTSNINKQGGAGGQRFAPDVRLVEPDGRVRRGGIEERVAEQRVWEAIKQILSKVEENTRNLARPAGLNELEFENFNF